MTNTKKKKGNKMKLLSAVGMLTVSAAMLVSSTFAWFSLNKNVTAQTLNITAKADTTYLLISEQYSTAADIRTENKTSVTFAATSNSAELYPAALAKDGTSEVNPSVNPTTANNWYFGEGTGYDDGTLKTGTKVEFNETTTKSATDDTTIFSERVLKKTLHICLAEDSEDATNLKVDLSNLTDGIEGDPTRVVVATATGFQKFEANATGTVVLANTISGDNVIDVDVYVYYDGDVAAVKTSNLTKIVGKTAEGITLTFNVDGPGSN
jgi:hypothetical protein